MKKVYKHNYIEIIFWLHPVDYTFYDSESNHKTCKTITIQATDDYIGYDRQLVLNKDNVIDIIDFLINDQKKRKPSPFVSKQDLMSSYGSFTSNQNVFTETNYNILYGMFTIKDSGDSMYITKKGEDIDLKFEIDERHGYEDTIKLSKIEKENLIKELKNIQW